MPLVPVSIDHSGGFAYLLIFLAAALEGEIVFVTAAVLVGLGRLEPYAVLLSGAFGGAARDQFFFFALRSRLRNWLARFKWFARRQNTMTPRIEKDGDWLMLSCRFLPGMWLAIPAACAYGGVAPARFVTLDLISAFAWAGSIMLVVGWAGPAAARVIGLGGVWGLLVPAILVVLFFRWVAHTARVPSNSGRRTRRSS